MVGESFVGDCQGRAYGECLVEFILCVVTCGSDMFDGYCLVEFMYCVVTGGLYDIVSLCAF